MFGSIPQQDVFQRITSAKNERTAVRGSILGGVLYFCFCFVPMFLAYSATLVDPTTFMALLDQDAQLVLPTLILRHTPVFAQIVFFGAVLSAVMSCASATLLAPSVMLSENVIKGALPHLSDWEFLRVMRLVLVVFAGIVLTIALTSNSTIYQLVVNTYKVTLVAAFVPLCAGLFWSRATTRGALSALVARADHLDRPGIVRSARLDLASATGWVSHGGSGDGCRLAFATENRSACPIQSLKSGVRNSGNLELSPISLVPLACYAGVRFENRE